ncbi:Hypp3327 [Branchiostoma lanceolatum]|uniref:Hypp3327 protein n=1 Tax=Branchiostoma lanceolatum TaxID=7740 RepID=A0A8K0A1X5_BRALA|nr:Hypp3327 [Branchiostoma lanceolatum]
MAVCVNIHAIPSIVNHEIKEELESDTFPLRRFQLVETSYVTAGEAHSRSQGVTETAVADTTLTTQAEIHQYSNEDTSVHSGDTEEGQDHRHASAAPSRPPVCDDEGSSSPGATGHSVNSDPLEAAAGQPASQIEDIESDEEERPYGIATENEVTLAFKNKHQHM